MDFVATVGIVGIVAIVAIVFGRKALWRMGKREFTVEVNDDRSDKPVSE